MRTCFVTGGNGFIGSHLIDSLVAGGWRVRALARDPRRLRWLPRDGVEMIEGDLDSEAALGDGVRGADVVFHAAALTRSRTEDEMFRVNLDGTRRVLEACLAASPAPALLFLSSQAAGGPSPDGKPMDETRPPSPRSAYGRSKLEAERVLLAAGDRLDVKIVRPPSVYGPRDSAFLTLFRWARRGVLPAPSGGRRLSVVHVDDLVAGTRLVAERGRGIYYITDGAMAPLESVLQTIASAVGRRARVVRVPKAVFLGAVWIAEKGSRLLGRRPPLTFDRAHEAVAREWICSDARARRELGYQSRWTLSDGMRETAEWYRRAGWL
jgi:nucleoside-diphosphate-sugar epimerase